MRIARIDSPVVRTVAILLLCIFFTGAVTTSEAASAGKNNEKPEAKKLFEAEKQTLSNFFSGQSKEPATSFSAFHDDFKKISKDTWEKWQCDGTTGASVTTKHGLLSISHSQASHHVLGGIITKEPLIAVPRVSRSHFKFSFDVDTNKSNAGSFLIRPNRSKNVIGEPQIRLAFSKDFKTGSFVLYIDGVSSGCFAVPLVNNYEVSLSLGFDGIAVYDSNGKKRIKAKLPSWAYKGTSHYLFVGILASSVEEAGHLFSVNSVAISYPRRMAAACPVYRCGNSIAVIDDSFSTISNDVWDYWTEGNTPGNTVKATSEGLSCSVEKTGDRGNPWGRMGIISKEPVVVLPEESDAFSVINLVIDSTATSGARIALLSEPRDVVWASPHIRFGMERRGYYCQGWIGHESDLEALFDFPLSDECEFSLIIGKYGVYILDPGCLLVGSFPRPEWGANCKGLHLLLYGQASRPGESVSFLYRSIEVTSRWCPVEAASHAPTRKSSSPVMCPALEN